MHVLGQGDRKTNHRYRLERRCCEQRCFADLLQTLPTAAPGSGRQPPGAKFWPVEFQKKTTTSNLGLSDPVMGLSDPVTSIRHTWAGWWDKLGGRVG